MASHLAFAPDGKTLATGGESICLWDVATGQEIRRWKCKDRTNSLAFSPDGKTLASTDEPNVVHLWDPATGKERRRLEGHKGYIYSLAFSPDGKQVASAGWREKTAIFWDVATGQEVGRLTDPTHEVYQVLFSPNGKTLVTGSAKGLISWWDLATSKVAKKFEGHNDFVEALALTRDGRTLFSGSRDGPIRVWDVETAKEVRTLERSSKRGSRIGAMALSPNEKVLASCEYHHGWGGNVVRLWDIATGKEICPANGHEKVVLAVGWAPDGKTVTSVSADATVRKWDASTGDGTTRIDQRYCSHATLSPDTRVAALFDADGFSQVHLWDLLEGKELAAPNIGRPWGPPQFSPGGEMLAMPVFAGGKPGVSLIDPHTGKELRHLADLQHFAGFTSYGTRQAFSPDGTLLATVGDSPPARIIYLFDAATGKEVRQIANPSGMDTGALAFSPDGRTLATWQIQLKLDPQGMLIELDQILILWEIATGAERARLTKEQYVPGESPRGCLSFSPDGRTLAASGVDHAVHLWDVATGKERHRLEGHRGRVAAVAFSADGQRLISGSEDTSLLVWDLLHMPSDKPVGGGRLAAKEVETLWAGLASGDAAQAYQAMAKLTGAPAEAIALFRERLHPPAAPDLKRVPGLLADLDGEDFSVREKAAEGLEKLGAAAEPALRQALKGQLSAEAQRQVERLLEKLGGLAPELLQAIRALEVLERLNTPESRQLLEELAAGPADAYLAKEAKGITRRLALKDKK
jgi:WD40 repeat protein